MDTGSAPGGPTLDRSCEPWLGVFPGLGSVTVDRAGVVTVTVEASDSGEPAELRERALRHGWAEGLSFLRRGFRLARGAAVGPPEDTTRCVVLSGDPDDVAMIIVGLTRRGWTVMTDRFTPTKWHGDALVASPRVAPLIMSDRRLAAFGLDGQQVRGDSDSCAVELPRTHHPRTVSAICHVRRRRVEQMRLVTLVGHERFQAATSLLLGGIFAPSDVDATRSQDLSDHLRLAALAHVRLSMDSSTAEQDTEALIAWWGDLGQEPPV